MKIDWKEDENYSKRLKLTMINSSENDIRLQNYHNTAKKRGLNDKHTSLLIKLPRELIAPHLTSLQLIQ
jgi:hypothetical protein